MKLLRLSPLVLLGLLSLPLVRADEITPPRTPAELLGATLAKWMSLIEPAGATDTTTFHAEVELTRTDGLPKGLANKKARVAFQAPDRFLVGATVDKSIYTIGRDQQELWMHVAEKKWGVIGKPGVPKFASRPEDKDTTRLGPLHLPIAKEQLALAPLLFTVEQLPAETNDTVACFVLKATPKPEAMSALKIPAGELRLSIRACDLLPSRVAYNDGKKLNVELHFIDPKLGTAEPDAQWKIPARAEDKIETTAVSHITRFVSVALASLGDKIPTLGPATGDRHVVATEGSGRLESIDGTRVLFLKGTPEEMGHQEGVLLKREIRDLVNHILYEVGVGSSFAKGRWFFGEIETAQSHLLPHMNERYLREMDAIALAVNMPKEEVRLANYFPELFHCSGFALSGSATADGKMYHGRILDYLKGMGLEQNAVVTVIQPDVGNAWVNISYAGFVGSVTAMNEKHLSIGEMGGRGEGHWDGIPMAQLVREVMEKAGTLDEAVELMRKAPRTCEYYYVIADAKSNRAVGIAATPGSFEVVHPGESHPRLPHAIRDAVLMSAGDRYEELAKRVSAGHGTFTVQSARDLMTRPVCMQSNIHSVLFEPETLDFWVANADSQNPASHTRYTHYNLAELLGTR